MTGRRARATRLGSGRARGEAADADFAVPSPSPRRAVRNRRIGGDDEDDRVARARAATRPRSSSWTRTGRRSEARRRGKDERGGDATRAKPRKTKARHGDGAGDEKTTRPTRAGRVSRVPRALPPRCRAARVPAGDATFDCASSAPSWTRTGSRTGQTRSSRTCSRRRRRDHPNARATPTPRGGGGDRRAPPTRAAAAAAAAAAAETRLGVSDLARLAETVGARRRAT